MTNLAMLAQAVITIFGVSAVFFSQAKTDKARRWASVCGLIAQPAWLYSSASAGQWGILVVSLLYTLAWLKGFYAHWIAPRFETRNVTESAGDPQRENCG